MSKMNSMGPGNPLPMGLGGVGMNMAAAATKENGLPPQMKGQVKNNTGGMTNPGQQAQPANMVTKQGIMRKDSRIN